jgi:hypothetical protein
VRQIGLEFSPVSAPGTKTDVVGAIWIDQDVPVLRSVDFHFTGPDSFRDGPGGRVSFRTMSNGITFVESWNLRIPMLRVRMASTGSVQAGRISSSHSEERVVDEIYSVGGRVISVRWADSVSWAAPPTGITGSVTEGSTQRPVARVLVTLEGTADTVSGDSLGHFDVPLLIPGRYRMHVADTSLAAYARDRTDVQTVQVTDGQVVSVRAELPPIGETIAQVCHDPRSPSSPAVLVGRIGIPNSGASNASSRLQATWRTLPDRTVARTKLAGIELSRDVDVDSRGRFIVCGLPLDQNIRLRISAGRAHADTNIVITRYLVHSLEWQPLLRP